ncbi:XRE family transcriptional regulator [Rhizocola hellebori]|nr:XRE family transcriptional regulator [Rhizocola hellebori]
MDRPLPRTLLEQLVRRSRRTIEENCSAFEHTGREQGEKVTLSPRHLSRWMAGKVASARPVAQRVAALHWGYAFEMLVGQPLSEAELRLARGEAEPTITYARPQLTGESALDSVELLRRALHDAISIGNVSEAGLDEWELTVHTHGQATRFRPAALMLAELATDFADLQRLLERRHSALALRRLTRTAAQMAGLMFLTLIKLDEPLAARNWARTARVAADEAGDIATRSWVHAQEAYVHYYAGNLAEAVAVARHAQAIAGRMICVGLPLAAALEARVHGVLGRRQEAKVALDKAEATVAVLDLDARMPSAFGYNEAQLRFHAGNTYTHLNDTELALAAQREALTLYPERDYLDRALVRLDGAACLAYDGELDQAMQAAAGALLDLTEEQRCGLAWLRAREIWQSLPTRHQVAPAARELRDLLMLMSKGGEPK